MSMTAHPIGPRKDNESLRLVYSVAKDFSSMHMLVRAPFLSFVHADQTLEKLYFAMHLEHACEKFMVSYLFEEKYYHSVVAEPFRDW